MNTLSNFLQIWKIFCNQTSPSEISAQVAWNSVDLKQAPNKVSIHKKKKSHLQITATWSFSFPLINNKIITRTTQEDHQLTGSTYCHERM